MKGILYGNFLLNKKWFIAAGIVAVPGTAFCALFASLVPDNNGVVTMLFTGLQFVIMAILIEWLGRNLEANIKCRFTDVTLAGGISKNMFVMSELLKNLLTIGIGFAVCVIMQLVMSVFDKSFFTLESVRNIVVLALFFGAVEWAINPLVITFKSSEKAGLLVGLVLGFGVIMPLMLVCNIVSGASETLISGFLKLMNGGWLPLVIVGISAALYAVFYFILLARVKRGDVC